MTLNLYYLILIISGSIGFILFAYSLSHIRIQKVFIPLSLLFLAASSVSFISLLYYFVPIRNHFIVKSIEFIFFNLQALAVVLSCLMYTKELNKYHNKIIPVTIMLSAVGYLCILTNPFHNLFYRYSTIYFKATESYGPLFWFNIVIAYILVLSGAFLIIKRFLYNKNRNNLLLVFAVIIPIVFNFIRITGITRLTIDFTSVAFIITGSIFLYIIMIEEKIGDNIMDLTYIIDHMNVGILVLSANNEVITYNRSFKSILGIQDEYIYRSSDIITIVNRIIKNHSEIKKITGALIGTNIEFMKEVLLDNPKTTVRIDIKSIFKNRSEIGKVISITDLSNVKNLKNLNLTLELINKRLETERKEQQKILDHFSHDLMTPISSIEGYTSYLLFGKLGELNEKQKKSLKIIDSNIKRLEKMIQNILTMVKIKNAKDYYVMEKFNLKQLMLDAYENRNILAIERGYDFRIDIESHNNMIYADKQKIRVIIDNFLDNAFKYTPEEGIIIIYSDEKDNSIIFGVKNSGAYLSQNEIEEIKKPFVQLNKSNCLKGVGLGLAIVDSIARAHNGKLIITSNKFGLNNFVVSIPCL
jgi:signal transduction histidine kinase